MRITENGLTAQVLKSITDSYGKLAEAQEQLATSKRINRPSDDPLGSSLVLRFQATTASLEEYQRSTDAAQEWLENTATALTQVTDVLEQAKEIAVQGSSDTGSDTRTSLAAQANQLLESLVSLSGTRFSDRYIFGGTQTATAPFGVTRDPTNDQITAVTANPQGIDGTVSAAVADGVRIQTNMPGDRVFTQTSSQTVDLFSELIQLRDALAADDASGVAATLDDLTKGMTQVSDASGQVGVNVQRLEAVRTQNTNDLQRIEELRSGLQDADIAEVYLELQKQQNAFQASLAAGARALQMSLLDFLG